MKKFSICFFILINYYSFSQIKYKEDRSIYYQEIIKSDLKKEELKKYVSKWVASEFKNTNRGIQYNGDEIIAFSSFSTYFLAVNGFGGLNNVDVLFNFLITISIKDNRYRIQFSDIIGKVEGLGISELQFSLIPKQNTIDDFKRVYIEFGSQDKFPNWYTKRIVKRTKKSKKLNKDWLRHSKQNGHIINKLETYFGAIVNNSRKNIKERIKDDW